MTFKYTALFLLYFGLLTANGTRAETQTLFTAEYEGKYSGMTIKSERTLEKRSSGEYAFTSRIKNLLGKITEESLFKKSEQNRFVPTEYSYLRKIFGRSSDQKMRFDWEENIASYERRDKPEKNAMHKIAPGILDPSLYQLQLQSDVAEGKKNFRYVIVKPNKIKVLEFSITGNEEIHVGDKAYKATRLQRINLDDNKETNIWVVPELAFQIARIDHKEENGDSYQIELVRFQANIPALKQFYASGRN